MLVVTTENIPGYRVVEVKGPAFGLVVRARGIGTDIGAFFRGLVGGEVKGYTAMLEDTRKQALDRMVQNAAQMGANAVVMVRFDSGSIASMTSEVVAFGTAVVVEESRGA